MHHFTSTFSLIEFIQPRFEVKNARKADERADEAAIRAEKAIMHAKRATARAVCESEKEATQRNEDVLAQTTRRRCSGSRQQKDEKQNGEGCCARKRRLREEARMAAAGTLNDTGNTNDYDYVRGERGALLRLKQDRLEDEGSQASAESPPPYTV